MITSHHQTKQNMQLNLQGFLPSPLLFWLGIYLFIFTLIGLWCILRISAAHLCFVGCSSSSSLMLCDVILAAYWCVLAWVETLNQDFVPIDVLKESFFLGNMETRSLCCAVTCVSLCVEQNNKIGLLHKDGMGSINMQRCICTFFKTSAQPPKHTSLRCSSECSWKWKAERYLKLSSFIWIPTNAWEGRILLLQQICNVQSRAD